MAQQNVWSRKSTATPCRIITPFHLRTPSSDKLLEKNWEGFHHQLNAITRLQKNPGRNFFGRRVKYSGSYSSRSSILYLWNTSLIRTWFNTWNQPRVNSTIGKRGLTKTFWCQNTVSVWYHISCMISAVRYQQDDISSTISAGWYQQYDISRMISAVRYQQDDISRMISAVRYQQYDISSTISAVQHQ
jgi:hypothetical protein